MKVTVSLFVPGETKGQLLGSFDTINEAEIFVAEHGKNNPESLNRGDYSIDAPEEMVNE